MEQSDHNPTTSRTGEHFVNRSVIATRFAAGLFFELSACHQMATGKIGLAEIGLACLGGVELAIGGRDLIDDIHSSKH